MRSRHLLGVLAVLLLILAIWLVPMALAASGGSAGPDAGGQTQTPSGAQCPFLQAHPWLDPHGSGDGAGGTAPTSGMSSEIQYY